MKEIEIIILSKISCKKEILSLLQSFSIYPNKEEINSFEKTKKNLSKALIPCWNNSSNFYAMSLLNPNFIDLNASISEVSENSQDIMEYVLINCFGENISKSTPIVALVKIILIKNKNKNKRVSKNLLIEKQMSMHFLK